MGNFEYRDLAPIDNIENGEAYDENSVVDELLKNSEMRMNNFKNKLSDKRGDGQE